MLSAHTINLCSRSAMAELGRLCGNLEGILQRHLDAYSCEELVPESGACHLNFPRVTSPPKNVPESGVCLLVPQSGVCLRKGARAHVDSYASAHCRVRVARAHVDSCVPPYCGARVSILRCPSCPSISPSCPSISPSCPSISPSCPSISPSCPSILRYGDTARVAAHMCLSISRCPSANPPRD